MQGFLNLHKPPHFTSHDCVARLRRLLQTQKVGHGGTLDPMATGVLPVAVGRATRLLQYLPTDKAYRAQVCFGLTTATDDFEGAILTQPGAAPLTRDHLAATLPQFLGTLLQRPPSYSAIQVGGQRLYALARQGRAVAAPLRQVQIHAIDLVAWRPGEFPIATVDIRCGPGTYIRAIARDLGAKLGPGATLAALERTHSSGFDTAQSLTFQEIEAQLQAQRLTLVPPEQGVQHLPALALEGDLARRWRLGQKIPAPPELPLDRPYRILQGERFLGISLGQIREEQRVLAPKLVFEPA